MRASLLLVGLLFATTPLAGQTTEPPTEDPGLIITTETSLVIVPLYVYKGRNSVVGLGKEAFELLENGVPQDIEFVEGPGSGRTVPVEINFLLDVSHSVLRRGLISLQAIRESFLAGDLKEEVSFAVYAFAEKLSRFTAPTRNLDRVEHALELAYAAEDRQTRLYEAIALTLRDVGSRNRNASRMLVVISDGLATSGFEPTVVVRAARSLGVPIYPVVLGHRRGASKEMQQLRFAEIGPQTGGQSFDLNVPSGEAVRSILASLAYLAESEYIVGYYPSSLGDEPTQRNIEVRLQAKKVGKLYGGRRTIVH
ncbi:MAG: VWA domain-containing protein [Bryobacterales bacterium]|nr:VWA domain-containing protein [Bryobacterales bacterium]